jgi:hypothetical protein
LGSAPQAACANRHSCSKPQKPSAFIADERVFNGAAWENHSQGEPWTERCDLVLKTVNRCMGRPIEDTLIHFFGEDARGTQSEHRCRLIAITSRFHNLERDLQIGVRPS